MKEKLITKHARLWLSLESHGLSHDASIRNITVQISIAKPHGDEVLAAANSRELIKNLRLESCNRQHSSSLPYRFLCGLKAKATGVKEAILDIGLIAPTKGAKAFAALNGVVDAGVDVPHSEEKIVKERTKGEHIAKYAKSLGAGSEEYNAKFSKYTAQGVAPEKIPEHFNKVKAEITDYIQGSEKHAAEKKEAPAKKKLPNAAAKPAKEKAPAKKSSKKQKQRHQKLLKRKQPKKRLKKRQVRKVKRKHESSNAKTKRKRN